MADCDEVYGWSRSQVIVQGVTTSQVDVTESTQVAAAFELYPAPMDLVIFCAATADFGKIGHQLPMDWIHTVETNVGGAYNTLDGHVRRFGHLPNRTILVGSEAAYSGQVGRSAYHASKAALDNFALSLRQEARSTGGSVCLLNPGRIDTEFTPRAEGRPAVSLAVSHVVAAIQFMASQPNAVAIERLDIQRVLPKNN